MDLDDLEPRQPASPKKKDLDAMSIEALKEYIAELEGEIARARKAIEKKGNARAAAESFFKN